MVLYKINAQTKKYPITKLKPCYYKIKISEIKKFEEKKSQKYAFTNFSLIPIL